MKYRLLLFLFITFFTLESVGQENLIGVNFKLSTSSIEPQEQWGDGLSNRNGIGLGINYNRVLNNKINLNLELAYHEKGIQGSIFGRDSVGQFNGKIFDSEYYFNYVSLPILIGYSFGNKFRIIPQIGFHTSYLLKAETEFPIIKNEEKTGEIKSNITDDVANFDYGIALKLNCIYFILDDLAIDLAYYYDRSLQEFDENNFLSSEESKHRFIGYSFGIKYLIK